MALLAPNYATLPMPAHGHVSVGPVPPVCEAQCWASLVIYPQAPSIPLPLPFWDIPSLGSLRIFKTLPPVTPASRCIRLSAAAIKHQPKAAWGRKDLFYLNYTVHHEGVRTVPQGRNGCEPTEGCCLLTSSACFLIQSRTTGLGVALPTVSWALLHQSSVSYKNLTLPTTSRL